MSIRSRVAAVVLAAGVATSGVALPAVAASAASCTTTHASSYSRTAKGTQSWESRTEYRCSKRYREWSHRVTQSYTGAYSVADTYKDAWQYPHWQSWETLQSWTKRGTYSVRHYYRHN